jgi:hypothetical protein
MSITVTSCTKVKEWNGKPIYSVEFSDNTKGNSFGSEIPVGTSKADLQVTPKDGYPDDVKMKRNGFGGGSKPVQRAGNESFAMSYAKDLVVAGKVEIKELLPCADKIFNWLQSKKQS